MIQVLYFAQLREMFNCEREDIALPEDIATLNDLRRLLSQRGGIWSKLTQKEKMPAAVNRQMAGENHVLRDGDEVAFFQPVSGG